MRVNGARVIIPLSIINIHERCESVPAHFRTRNPSSSTAGLMPNIEIRDSANTSLSRVKNFTFAHNNKKSRERGERVLIKFPVYFTLRFEI